MIEGFKHLTSEEFDLLVEAPALVTVLVGASDGDLDREERTWSEKMLRARTYTSPKSLNDFYRVAAEGFWAKVHGIQAHYPHEVEERNAAISKRLGDLNPVLAKLDPKIGGHLYKGLLRLAEEVAEASGGFLRIGAINAAEAEWLGLPMLTPIEVPAEETEVEETE